MGWDNPPVPWREFERRLSWGRGTGQAPEGADAGRDEGRAGASRPVVRLPVGPASPTPVELPPVELPWAELHCHSAYSFLDGASSPSDLVLEAAARGLSVLAITDHDGMYGVPQFAQSAARLRDSGVSLGTAFGAELSLDLARKAGARARIGRAQRGRAQPDQAQSNDVLRRPAGTPRAGVPDPSGRHLLVLARDPEGYRRLCRVISTAQLAGGEKGLPSYDEPALADARDGHWVILTGCRKGAVPAALATHGPAAAARELARLSEAFGRENVKVELTVG